MQTFRVFTLQILFMGFSGQISAGRLHVPLIAGAGGASKT